MQAKTLLLVSSLALAASALQAPPPAAAQLTKKPTTLVAGAGPVSTMTATNPLELAPAADADAVSGADFSGDPNETSPQLVERYQRARRLIAQGAWKRAQLVLERAIVLFPESRHLRALLADLLFYKSRGVDRTLLEQSGREAVRAMEIGLGFGVVDHGLTDRLSRTGDLASLDRLFTDALALDASAIVYFHYARGLDRMNDPRTDSTLKQAVDLEGEGDAMSLYGERLLDRKRDSDALDLLPKAPRLYYLHFLRGVALERLNRPDEAKAAYANVRDYSALFPVPARFRIRGSALQAASGIQFDDEEGGTRSGKKLTSVTAAITETDAINGLSYLIWGEAQGENYGGMLSEGWVVRARTLRGSVGSPACPVVSNSGATLADKYKSVMCQGSGSQFNGVCLAWCSNPASTCSFTVSTDNAAYDVFYGYGPDPVSGHCPSGISQSGASYCDGSIKCRGDQDTYKLRTALFNLGTSSTCSTHSCAPNSYGKVCGNGSLDNCFYGNFNCQGVNRVNYTGSIAATGGNSVSDPFNVTLSGIHNGHLEGPDSQDFDLYLQKSSSSGGPWTDVASSAHLSSTEEINYSGTAGWYRWRVYAYSGSGSFSLCTKRP